MQSVMPQVVNPDGRSGNIPLEANRDDGRVVNMYGKYIALKIWQKSLIGTMLPNRILSGKMRFHLIFEGYCGNQHDNFVVESTYCDCGPPGRSILCEVGLRLGLQPELSDVAVMQ